MSIGKNRIKMASKKKILLYDDNLFEAEVLVNKIKEANLDVIVVPNNEDILKKIKKEKPSLLILNVASNNNDYGLGMLKEIRESKSSENMPIIVMSENGDESYQKKIKDLGANGHLNSSAKADEIVSSIKTVLSGGILKDSTIKNRKAKVEKETDDNKKSDKKKTDGVYKSPFAEGDADVGIPPKLKIRIDKYLSSPREELSIINLVNDLIEYAYHARASDIHLEPTNNSLLARMRIDGILYDLFTLPKNSHSEVIARIKVLAGMRTDEHQAAQDGRFKASIKEPPREFDIRVSIVPTYYGENAVLRLLAEQSSIKTIDNLAFTKEDKIIIRRAIKKPYGMILATGPTGSGKSTTLYTIIRELNTRDTAIITIEDPVEYSIEGIDQIQVNERTGLTFATGLRAILRQDPNIIMVGEIRDKETASIAVNAALTGHKLLSTLHTNDAATTLPRLLDMGIEPFLIASTVNIILGQRLVRMLCQHCKVPKKLTDEEFKILGQSIPPEILGSNKNFYQAKTCSACGDTGYFDRMGIYEILEMSDEIRSAILRRADSSEIKEIAVKNGMKTLLKDGFQKAVDGLTTIEEILRVVKD